MAAAVADAVLAVEPVEERSPAALFFTDATLAPQEPVPGMRKPHVDQDHPVPQDVANLSHDGEEVLHRLPPFWCAATHSSWS